MRGLWMFLHLIGFVAWIGGNPYEGFVFENRALGPYAPFYWSMVFCNVAVPQIFWFGRARRSVWAMWVASVLINVGMWSERFVIVVTSLARDFVPSSWADYAPTWVDWSLFVGSIGFFSTLFLVFLKLVPAVSASEVKELAAETEERG